MTGSVTDDLSIDDFDEQINPPPEETEFDHIVERAMSRRTNRKGPPEGGP